MKTTVFIDAFNLYFGALKNTPWKWLNLETWLDRQFPRNTITAIKYFTARVKPFEGDRRACLRQEAYLAALSSLPRVKIVEGHYLVKETKALLARPPSSGRREVMIIRAEEKQSDVNLACHLLLDGFRSAYEAAIVVSGDGDLSTPIAMMTKEFSKKVVVLNPQRRGSYHLEQVATAYRGTHYRFINGVEKKIRNDGVRASLLQASQFPATVLSAGGKPISRPTEW